MPNDAERDAQAGVTPDEAGFVGRLKRPLDLAFGFIRRTSP